MDENHDNVVGVVTSNYIGTGANGHGSVDGMDASGGSLHPGGQERAPGAGDMEVRLFTLTRTWPTGRLEAEEATRRVLP